MLIINTLNTDVIRGGQITRKNYNYNYLAKKFNHLQLQLLQNLGPFFPSFLIASL